VLLKLELKSEFDPRFLLIIAGCQVSFDTFLMKLFEIGVQFVDFFFLILLMAPAH